MSSYNMRMIETRGCSRMNETAEPILKQEGLSLYTFPPGMQKSQRLIDASVGLFGFILPDEDFRWHFAYAYRRAREANRFSHQNLENALGATYLSKRGSRRNGEPGTVSEDNVRQLSRAISNLGAKPMLEGLYMASQPDILPEDVQFQFAVTDRIQEGKEQKAKPAIITPCPEALYQIRLFHQGNYLARVGFNIHIEDGATVASITNIQGRKKGKDDIELFSEDHGIRPFNLLLRRLKALADANPAIPIELRGLRNPRNIDSACLYNTVLKREGIRRFSRLYPKPNPNYTQPFFIEA
jgi:hypothetical protein